MTAERRVTRQQQGRGCSESPAPLVAHPAPPVARPISFDPGSGGQTTLRSPALIWPTHSNALTLMGRDLMMSCWNHSSDGHIHSIPAAKAGNVHDMQRPGVWRASSSKPKTVPVVSRAPLLSPHYLSPAAELAGGARRRAMSPCHSVKTWGNGQRTPLQLIDA